jgi:predicted enzyme involved in methoxymalonyl-ACP biosynthesis
MLSVVVDEARRLEARHLVGEYRPTAKNEMVRDHYRNLGFEALRIAEDGSFTARLDLNSYNPCELLMEIVAG